MSGRDDEIETLSPPIEGRLHLEYTYRTTVQLQNESAENWMTEIPQTEHFPKRNTLLYSNIAYTF